MGYLGLRFPGNREVTFDVSDSFRTQHMSACPHRGARLEATSSRPTTMTVLLVSCETRVHPVHQQRGGWCVCGFATLPVPHELGASCRSEQVGRAAGGNPRNVFWHGWRGLDREDEAAGEQGELGGEAV